MCCLYAGLYQFFPNMFADGQGRNHRVTNEETNGDTFYNRISEFFHREAIRK